MQGGLPVESAAVSAPTQNNSSEPSPNQLAGLPDLSLWFINKHLSSMKDTAHLACVNRRFRGLFQPEIEKMAAKESAEYAIYPTAENVEKFKLLLSKCPALLMHPATVKNRHGMAIQGTVYQIALHESDNELIEDVIRPAFARIEDGLAVMEAQRHEWFPAGWIEAEDETCRNAYEAIEIIFTVLKNAADANDITELSQPPYRITINHQGAKAALEACRQSIAALYKPTAKRVTGGRDPIVRLLDRVSDRCEENFDALGGHDSPRNNAIVRMIFGYCQRFAPINFMQAFAMGVHYIVGQNKKLIRSFEYRYRAGHRILPLDSEPLNLLGRDYYADGGASSLWCRDGIGVIGRYTKLFVNQKQQPLCDALTVPRTTLVY